MNLKFNRLISIALISFFTSGCATNVVKTLTSSPDYSQLYLRGVFTWWEADPKYKLKELASEVYATRVELIADGQPYDFRFADANWSPDLNCGYSDQQDDQVIYLDQAVKANCSADDQSFQFTPQETGLYQFIIDFSGFGSPLVTVQQLTN